MERKGFKLVDVQGEVKQNDLESDLDREKIKEFPYTSSVPNFYVSHFV